MQKSNLNFTENLSKIKRKEDKVLFNKRFQNRQKNMKLLKKHRRI